ncbi:MAG: DUF4375 domain-containing protein [Marinomonas sp.]
MTEAEQMAAWNNLIVNAYPIVYEKGDERRAAAIASTYMGIAHNGGLNHFLTFSWDLDAREVLAALETLGADVAADQLRQVLEQIDDPLPASTQDERWDRLDDVWTGELNALDALTVEADRDLVAALERHVASHAEHYLNMTAD